MKIPTYGNDGYRTLAKTSYLSIIPQQTRKGKRKKAKTALRRKRKTLLFRPYIERPVESVDLQEIEYISTNFLLSLDGKGQKL